MTTRSNFTIEDARRNRISGDTRTGYASGINQIVIWVKLANKLHLLKQSAENTAESTLDLNRFQYTDVLDFLVWTVRNKPTIRPGTLSGYRSAIKSLYRDESLAIPVQFGDDMKEIFSGMYNTEVISSSFIT